MGFLLLTAALGTTNPDFAMSTIRDLMEASREGSKFNPSNFKAILARVIGLKPRNESEACLAKHMAVVSPVIMHTARQTADAPHMGQQESAQRMYSA